MQRIKQRPMTGAASFSTRNNGKRRIGQTGASGKPVLEVDTNRFSSRDCVRTNKSAAGRLSTGFKKYNAHQRNSNLMNQFYEENQNKDQQEGALDGPMPI